MKIYTEPVIDGQCHTLKCDMNNLIPIPAKGRPMTATWGAAVANACNAMYQASSPGTLIRDGAGAFGSAPIVPNLRNRKSRTPHYFDVVWRKDIEKALIYLPSNVTEKNYIVQVNGQSRDVLDGVSGLVDSNGNTINSDWCSIDDSSADSKFVWLCIPKSPKDADGNDSICKVTCVDPNKENSQSNDQESNDLDKVDYYSVVLAEIQKPYIPPDGVDDLTRTVYQFVIGAIIVFTPPPRPFDIANNKITNCKIYCGNQLLQCDDYTLTSDGDIWAKITLGSDYNYTLEIVESVSNTNWTNTVAYVKLYERSNGQINLDMRPT